MKNFNGFLPFILMAAVGAEGSAGGGGLATDTASTAAAPEVKEKVPGVGDLAKDLIRNGKTNEEVLATVKEKFPEAKTSMASINWYRNKLRNDGEKVPTARELKADVKDAEKAEKDAAKAAAKAEKDAAKAAEKATKDAAKAAEKAAKESAKAEAKAAKEAAKAATKDAATGAADTTGEADAFLK